MLYSPKTASQLFTSWKYIIAADEPNIYETSRECAHKHHLPTPQTSSRCDFSDSASQSAAAESKCPSATNLSMWSGLTMDNGPLTGFFCPLESINVTSFGDQQLLKIQKETLKTSALPLCETSWPDTEVIEDARLWHLHLPGREVDTSSESRCATKSRWEV